MPDTCFENPELPTASEQLDIVPLRRHYGDG